MPRHMARGWRTGRGWLWGAALGVCVGAGVVLVSTLLYGFSAQLFALGVVLAVAFGGLALMGEVIRGRAYFD
jgi:hypothetical protein